MPTALDVSLFAAATAIIEKYGKALVFKVPGEIVTDQINGIQEQVGVVAHSVKCSPPDEFTEEYPPLVQARPGDLMTIIPRQTEFTPDLGMVVEFDSMIWRVVGLRPLYSGELIAATELHLRKHGSTESDVI